jgi:hypothetical protein
MTEMNTALRMAGVFLAWTVFTTIPAAIASFPLERRRRTRMPGTKPYTWGIYVGLSVLLLGCIPLVGGLLALLLGGFVISADFLGANLNSDLDEGLGAALLLVVVGLPYVAAGFSTLRRQRIGFIASTVLTFNVLWWLINAVYGRNRWAEFGAASEPKDPAAPADIRVH